MTVNYEYEQYWGKRVVSEMYIYKNSKEWTVWIHGWFYKYKGLSKIRWWNRIINPIKCKRMKSMQSNYLIGINKSKINET